ncbi:hypothetical protein CDAR_210181 [Caerostris darwini]|uniref:Uncharacterized protein n=1 Tax=Caerostris darwini TaxID=1538125 RepID=A0AAV4SVA1_9ARAC|nr:hypothetical protein CDAR_210181 [Caerostris darwini]
METVVVVVPVEYEPIINFQRNSSLMGMLDHKARAKENPDNGKPIRQKIDFNEIPSRSYFMKKGHLYFSLTAWNLTAEKNRSSTAA